MASIEGFLKLHADARQLSLSGMSLLLVSSFVGLVYANALGKRIKRRSPSLTGLWIHVPLIATQAAFIYAELTKSNASNPFRLAIYAMNGLIWVISLDA
jgi:hypothetical protein